ncbi:MAG: chemotaxis protein CheW [Alphaproteobacteria bacterium]|nr:chemotaxis protein CheW [Alphaproteobacteria bacterium]
MTALNDERARSESVTPVAAAGSTEDFVTLVVGKQRFGIPVLAVRDVLGPQRIARIPLAPKEVAGSLNLRGRIVTAIDVRQRLGMTARDDRNAMWCIVVDRGGELYSLLVDAVGEVLSLPVDRFERNVSTIEPLLREVSKGIYRLDDVLLVVLDIDSLLDLRKAAA